MNPIRPNESAPVDPSWACLLARPRAFLRFVFIAMGVTIGSSPAAWAANPTFSPLEPPDTSSPQATMRSYLVAMEGASESFRSLMERYREEPGYSFSPAAQEHFERLGLQLNRARRCLNLRGVSPQLTSKVGLESTLLLKEIFDRIDLPALDSVPDTQTVEERHVERWRIPHTEIVIAKVTEGDLAEEFLFSPETIERLPEFYDAIRSRPYKPGAWEGVYEFYGSIGRQTAIPWKLTDGLPAWAKTQVLEQALWRWVVLGLSLVLIVAGLIALSRWSRRGSLEHPILRYGRRIVMPATVSAAAWLLRFLVDAINVTGHANIFIMTMLGTTQFIAAAWAIALLGNVLAEIVVSAPQIRKRSLDEAMARLATRLGAFVMAALVLLYGAHTLGLPVVPLVAGLGVGSLALALAAQPTIENFIAGLTLYADRQVRVGDFCRFGETLGTVEEIGMRSTRIRTLDHTVVSVPNADFSKARLENYSARKKIWYHPRIHLPYEVSPDQLRCILLEAHHMLRTHPHVVQDSPRIRFAEFGEYSLDLDIFAYIDTTDYARYLEIAEDLNLRVMDIVASAGTHLAIPVQIEYQAESPPSDAERKRQAEERAREWSARGTPMPQGSRATPTGTGGSSDRSASGSLPPTGESKRV